LRQAIFYPPELPGSIAKNCIKAGEKLSRMVFLGRGCGPAGEKYLLDRKKMAILSEQMPIRK